MTTAVCNLIRITAVDSLATASPRRSLSRKPPNTTEHVHTAQGTNRTRPGVVDKRPLADDYERRLLMSTIA